MQEPIELDSLTGDVRASNEDLAQALMDVLATGQVPTFSEDDLLEAVTLDLDTDVTGGSLSDFALPA